MQVLCYIPRNRALRSGRSYNLAIPAAFFRRKGRESASLVPSRSCLDGIYAWLFGCLLRLAHVFHVVYSRHGPHPLPRTISCDAVAFDPGVRAKHPHAVRRQQHSVPLERHSGVPVQRNNGIVVSALSRGARANTQLNPEGLAGIRAGWPSRIARVLPPLTSMRYT